VHGRSRAVGPVSTQNWVLGLLRAASFQQGSGEWEQPAWVNPVVVPIVKQGV
jgi:hypothetical protein